MSHIFLSYAREDRGTAEQLAAALEAEQLDVWWDYELAAGDDFRERLQAELKTAHAVVVLWSPHSIRSSFVRDEAGRALARGALVPVVIGGLSAEDLPLGFGEVHAQELSGWKGDRADRRYTRVLAALRKRLSAASDSGASDDGTASAALLQRRAEDAIDDHAGATHQGWTKGRSLLLLSLVLSITIVAVWLISYSAHYVRVATIVGGVWSAVLAALGLFKIRAKETSLSDFLGLPPVKATIVTYTILILGAIPLFVMWELPVHRVQVWAPKASDTIPLRVAVLRQQDTVHLHLGALQPVWRFYTRRGAYLMNAAPQDHESQSRSLQVGWFTFSQRIVLDEFRRIVAVNGDTGKASIPSGPGPTVPPGPGPTVPARPEERRGELLVSSTPNGLAVFVDGKDSGKRTPASLELRPGRYTLELRGRVNADDNFGFYRSRNVQVRPGESTRIDDSLSAMRLPTLFILSRQGSAGATYYLDSSDDAGWLGQIPGTSRTFSVFPGERVILKKLGSEVTRCERVSLAPDRRAEITC